MPSSLYQVHRFCEHVLNRPYGEHINKKVVGRGEWNGIIDPQLSNILHSNHQDENSGKTAVLAAMMQLLAVVVILSCRFEFKTERYHWPKRIYASDCLCRRCRYGVRAGTGWPGVSVR